MSLWFFPSAWCLAHPRLLKGSKLLCGYILNEASLLAEGAIPAVALYYFFGEHSQSLVMMINRGGDSERIWPCPTGVLVLVRFVFGLTSASLPNSYLVSLGFWTSSLLKAELVSYVSRAWIVTQPSTLVLILVAYLFVLLCERSILVLR